MRDLRRTGKYQEVVKDKLIKSMRHHSVRSCVRAFVRACVRACVRVRVRVWVWVCVGGYMCVHLCVDRVGENERRGATY